MNVNEGTNNKVQTIGNGQEQEGQIRLCQKTSIKAPEGLESDLWTDKKTISKEKLVQSAYG